jgi:predicted MFS family arabinose efflux permease
MYTWISLNSVGAPIPSRMADRMRRRRIVLLSLLLTPICSLAAAISASARLVIVFELVVHVGIGATFGSSLRNAGGSVTNRKAFGRARLGQSCDRHG